MYRVARHNLWLQIVDKGAVFGRHNVNVTCLFLGVIDASFGRPDVRNSTGPYSATTGSFSSSA
jgi:hypothetical protein